MTTSISFDLVRMETGPQGTFGILTSADKHYTWNTGELPKFAGNADALNERQTDCIPAGTYLCHVKNSAKYGRVYQLSNVPNRDGILIHSGNYCGDTAQGFKSHVLGCIILGKGRGVLDGQKAVLQSKTALAEFIAYTDLASFTLRITETF